MRRAKDCSFTLHSCTASKAEWRRASTDLASASEAAESSVRASIACCLPEVSASRVLEFYFVA